MRTSLSAENTPFCFSAKSTCGFYGILDSSVTAFTGKATLLFTTRVLFSNQKAMVPSHHLFNFFYCIIFENLILQGVGANPII